MPSGARFSDASLGAVMVATAERRNEAIVDNSDQSPYDHPAFTLGMTIALGVVSAVLFVYVVVHLTLFAAGYTPIERVSSALLLLSQTYVLMQSLGYYVQTVQTLRATNVARTTRLALNHMPQVAIYLATYNEPEDVIEDTVVAISLLDYPNKDLYINCDHPSPEQGAMVERIARRHNVNFIHRIPNTGYKAGGINDFINRLGRDLPPADLLCIFDADSIPIPTFLREFVLYFQADPRLAYVQAPQFYGNTHVSAVAEAAGHQQATFAHYISEGKQESQAMFYCGTNVVFSIEALRDIGGLIVESVTEDFATSMKLHARGWRSEYCNTTYVTGMGPTTLHAYWTQQGRWALGNIESFLAALPSIALKRGFTFMQRWEYMLTGLYYFVGWNAFISILLPILFLLGNIRPLVLSPQVYLLAFVPHVLLANWYFFVMMGKRGYHPRTLFLAQCLTFISFPIFMSSAVAALLHRKKPFAVTPKAAGDVLPLWQLRWQLLAFALLCVAVVVGTIRFALTGDLSIFVNVLWCAYHVVLLSTIRTFNQPEKFRQVAMFSPVNLHEAA